MKRMFTALAAVLFALAGFVPASAQTYVLNQTTTSAAVTASASTVSLTSASAATGSTFGAVAVGQMLFIDTEPMIVTSVSSTTIGVQRRARPTAHLSGAVVYIGSPAAFPHGNPALGACTLSAQGDPWINVDTGMVWRCTNGSWANVVDEYIFLGPASCNSSVSGNSTGTNGFTALGTAPSLPVVQAQTSNTGTNTHYFMCVIAPPVGRIDPGRSAWVVDVQFYYGVQTTGLGTQVATLASGTMNSKTVFTKIAYPVPGASETATGLAEATRADSGTLAITPAVASFNVATTTAGEFYSATFTPAAPILVSADRTQLLFTASLLNTATSATVTNSPGLLVHYRRVTGL